MLKAYRYSMYKGEKIRSYSFDDVYDVNHETIACPQCEAMYELKSLISIYEDDLFGGAHVLEVCQCVVCDNVFEVHQHFSSEEWSNLLPF